MSGLPRILEVAHQKGAYPVVVQAGLLETIGGWLRPHLPRSKATIVSDENVWRAHGGRLSAALAASNIEMTPIILPAGEPSKSWATLASLIDKLTDLETERTDTLIGFGGGVVGDLSGFAAAILKRGCNHIQIPTSLLAQVDSSVGGKTGINTAQGKNLVGAFHQPSAVLIDPQVLSTLPERELRSGYAEIVKYGLIGDADFFSWCEGSGAALIAGDVECRAHAIAKSVEAKASIVREDEKEISGRRALLNFGHSFGHALEAETGFSNRLLHGEAVSIGMCLALRFSASRGFCTWTEVGRAGSHLHSLKLPTRISDIGLETSGALLAAHMRHDKKSAGGELRLILVRGIGCAFLEGGVPISGIEDFLTSELEREIEDAPLR